jgi:hypothetical protein
MTEPLWTGRPDPPPPPVPVKGRWPRKSVLAAFSLIPIGFLRRGNSGWPGEEELLLIFYRIDAEPPGSGQIMARTFTIASSKTRSAIPFEDLIPFW